MRAMVLTGHGGLDKLEYHVDWPVPVAGRGQVLIRVAAAGLNNTDINTRSAWYSGEVKGGTTRKGGGEGFAEATAEKGTWGGAPMQFPRIQGADAAGRIVAVGDDSLNPRIGERVLVDPWLLDAEKPRYFGSEVDGAFAEYTCVPAQNAVAVTSDWSDAELATIPCAYQTAENLVNKTGLGEGEVVVIAGASGGVGSAAIQLCKARGAKVIAIAAKAKVDDVLSVGADTVVDRDSSSLADAIKEAAGGEVDVALDVVGSDTFTALVDSLVRGGRYSSSGAIAGAVVDFDIRKLIYRDLRFTGATVAPPGTMQRVVTLIEAGKLKPVLAASFPLKSLADAQEAFMAKQHTGNIVVDVSRS